MTIAARVAEQFDHAARTSGFLSISGHGVDPDVLTNMLDVTAQFFDRPPAEKMAYFVEDRAANRGYAPEGSEALAYSLGEEDLPTDLFEAFNCGLELTDEQLADPYYAARRDTLFAANVWPSEPPEFRETWLTYLERGRPSGERRHVGCRSGARDAGGPLRSAARQGPDGDPSEQLSTSSGRR